MTQEEIQERNVHIARMCTTEPEVLEHDLLKAGTAESMQYHSDYDWIMEAVEYVESCGYDVFINGLYCRITDSGMSDFEIESGEVSNKKEAVFIAVSDFAKLLNEGKL